MLARLRATGGNGNAEESVERGKVLLLCEANVACEIAVSVAEGAICHDAVGGAARAVSAFEIVEEGGDFGGREVRKVFEAVVGEERAIEAEVHIASGLGNGRFFYFVEQPVEEGRRRV